MKINTYLHNLITISSLKKKLSILIYNGKIPKSKRMKAQKNLQHLLALHIIKQKKFVERFTNSVYWKLAELKTWKSKSKKPFLKELINNLIKIYKYCEIHKINPNKTISFDEDE